MKKISTLFIFSSVIITLILISSGKIQSGSCSLTTFNLFDSLAALIKTIVVVFVWAAGVILMIALTIIDIFVTILTRNEFPILHYLYQRIIVTFSQSWYWDQYTGYQILLSAMLLFSIGIVYLGFPAFRRYQTISYIHHSKPPAKKAP